MKTICVCLAVFGLFLGGCSDSKPDLREGKWSVTAQVEMPGMPFKMPPMVYEECLTQDDIIPSNDDAETGCTLDGPKVKGNTVSWVSTCKNEDGSISTSEGTVTYAGESFSGKILVKITGEQPMTADNTITGKYLGPCE